MSAEAFEEKDRLLGRYRLMQRLARGGMAELFLAKATGIESFEKIVVLKRILPHLADDEEFIRMFLREAKLAATLNHPNIVSVHDIGSVDGEYFFTMEYLHGENLRHIIARATEDGGKLPLEHALTIALGMAAGLDHAHRQVGFDGRPLGIVHRDVSPSNVIITDSGTVKVVDFGIATAAALTRASRHSTLKGKAGYMSPEQCRGARSDRRSDIFAIGLVLQELLVGHGAFEGVAELNILQKIASGKIPSIRDAWPQCPGPLADVLARALQRDPAKRFQTAGELHDSLEDFAHEHRVRVSTAALGRFLRDTFGDRPYPWLDGVAPDPLPERPSLSLSPTPMANDARQAALGPLFDPAALPDEPGTAPQLPANGQSSPDTRRVARATAPALDPPQPTTAVALQPATGMEGPSARPGFRIGWPVGAALASAAALGVAWFALSGSDTQEAEPAASRRSAPPNPTAVIAPAPPDPNGEPTQERTVGTEETQPIPTPAPGDEPVPERAAQPQAEPEAEEPDGPPAVGARNEADEAFPRKAERSRRPRRPRPKSPASSTRAKVDPNGLLPY